MKNGKMDIGKDGISRNKKRGKERGYNINVLMSSKIRIDDAIGLFETDSSGEPLVVKNSGNGAVIPFLKRFVGKRAVVFVLNGE